MSDTTTGPHKTGSLSTCETTATQIDFSLVLDVGELSDEHAFDGFLVHVEIISLEIEEIKRKEPLVQLIWECACIERTTGIMSLWCGKYSIFVPVRPRPLKSMLVSLLKADRSPKSSCRFTARMCTSELGETYNEHTGRGYRSAVHTRSLF